MKKKLLSLLLVFTMLLSTMSLASCTPASSPVNSKPGSGALTTKNLQNIYQASAISTIDTIFENVEINSLYKLKDGKFLVNAYTTDTYEQKYYITDIDFKNASELTISKSDSANSETYVQSITVNPDDGSIWYIKNVYTYSETPIDGNVPLDGGEVIIGGMSTGVIYDAVGPEISISVPATNTVTESNDQYFLVKVDSDGNLVSETNIDSLLNQTDEDGNTYRGYISNMIFSDGKLIMNISSNTSQLYVVNPETAQIESQFALDEGGYVDYMFAGASGTLYFSSWGDNGPELKKFDIQTGKSEAVETPFADNMYNYSFSKGEFGYELLLVDSDSLYGYNIGDTEPTEICNFTNSDVVSNNRVPIVLEDGRLLLAGYDYETRENELLLLTKVDPAQAKEKYVITVAGRYIDYNLKNAHMKFNRTSEDYKVVFKEYSKYDNESNEWTGSYQELDKDILSKDNAPDIILVDSYGMDYESYISKGVFADLEEYMDADETFNKEDYLTNVLEALKVSGGLYMISPTVSFMTYAGKKSVFGDKTGWTMQEFLDMHNSLAEGEEMISEATRDSIGYFFISVAQNEFIDENGKCDFTNQNFKNMLSYLKDIPADYTAYQDKWQDNPNYYQEMELAYSKGTIKLRPAYISNFDIIPELEAYMGEEVSLIGYPSSDEDSVGVLISPETELAINANSKVSAGAWEVIKYVLSDEYQNKFSGDENNYSYSFPLKKSIVEKKKVNDIKPRYYTYTDENGNEVQEEQKRTVWIGDQTIELRKSTEADVGRLYELISKASVCLRRDQKMYDIVMGEAQPFFDGQKSVDEVANIINSRIQIMVNERR